VARRLGEILFEWSAFAATPLPARSASVPRPTSLTWGRLEGALQVVGVEDWRPGERRTVEVRLRNLSFGRWLCAEAGAGGIALEVSFVGPELHPLGPWIPLPVDLHPLEERSFPVALRRPLGPCRLRIEPHLIGGGGFSSLGGPVWEAAV
jgi:hypothetical protein